MFLTKEHYNPNTNNLYDGQNNIPKHRFFIKKFLNFWDFRTKFSKNYFLKNFLKISNFQKLEFFVKNIFKKFRKKFCGSFLGLQLKCTKINHSIPAIACRESQFPKFAVYENTKNHVEITVTEIWVFARNFARPKIDRNSTNERLWIFDGHVRRWYRLSIVPRFIFMGSNFIGRKDERIWLDKNEKDESDDTVRWLSDDMRMNQSENRTILENFKLIKIQVFVATKLPHLALTPNDLLTLLTSDDLVMTSNDLTLKQAFCDNFLLTFFSNF